MSQLLAAAVAIAEQHDLPATAVPSIVDILQQHGLGEGVQPETRDEVTTSEAARLLNVDRKTVRKYIAGGLLPYRDKATPGSVQARRLISVADIRRLKSYGFAPAKAEPVAKAKKTKTTSPPKFKHLNLDVSF